MGRNIAKISLGIKGYFLDFLNKNSGIPRHGWSQTRIEWFCWGSACLGSIFLIKQTLPRDKARWLLAAQVHILPAWSPLAPHQSLFSRLTQLVMVTSWMGLGSTFPFSGRNRVSHSEQHEQRENRGEAVQRTIEVLLPGRGNGMLVKQEQQLSTSHSIIYVPHYLAPLTPK